MIDPRRVAILVRPKDGAGFDDRTRDIAAYKADRNGVDITFAGSWALYSYGWDRIVILHDPVRIALDECALVEVGGSVWENVTEVWRFGTWWRIFYHKKAGDDFRTYRAEEVRILRDAGRGPRAAEILAYWRAVASGLPGDDSLRQAYAELRFVHPDSALAQYLNAEPIADTGTLSPTIFPFRGNLSQQRAVEQALRHSVSVVEGPPGTGKTQTILNVIANIISDRRESVAVVSYNNAAVDNVSEKLSEEGFGYAAANLGPSDKQAEFFAAQHERNAEVDRLVSRTEAQMPPPQQLTKLEHDLRRLREVERRRVELRREIDSYRLEQRHFGLHLERHELPDLADFPLLRRSPDRILDYLAETASGARRDGRIRQLIRRVRRYLRYGRTGTIDPGDTDVVLALQYAYYDRKIAELQKQIERAEGELARADFDRLASEHQRLSAHTLRVALRQRYASRERNIYSKGTFRRPPQSASFRMDYPVVLSTCHSLARSIASGYLLDYLIIDEASQVNLLAAGVALACARKVVVVGDQRQLPHIVNEAAAEGAPLPPAAAYDYRRNNILSSMIELYGSSLPRTMLREHYRCDPAIIGFCNRKFYDGQLIPYTGGEPGVRPLAVVRTAEGNHMRQYRQGGRSNQREVDVIVQEVIPQYCANTRDEDIGITTPYRRQVSKITDAFINSIESDTVHRFQGRQRDVVIMTTVLDETWRGKLGIAFVDGPHLVNVAVSRAAKRFLLVTNHSMLPSSRNLRDLIGYIEYQNPDEPVYDSAIVSVFDLLYREYSPRLRALADRLEVSSRYKSENILLTKLYEILAEEPYRGLLVLTQVLLRNLLPDLIRLTAEQVAYVKRRASVDFVVYNRVTMQLALAIEVDGFQFHEDNPEQLRRDALKNAVCQAYEIPLLRLPTTGSGEDRLIRMRLDAAIGAEPNRAPITRPGC